jgi:hypothetical protein
VPAWATQSFASIIKVRNHEWPFPEVSTPIAIGSLPQLFSSRWPVAPVVTMTVDRLTPNDEDYGAALNALLALVDLGAIAISPGDIDPASASPANQTPPGAAKQEHISTGHYPALTVSFRVPGQNPGDRREDKQFRTATKLWCRLLSQLNPGDARATRCANFPTTIMLNAHTLYAPDKRVPVYPITTRSALGVLKAATEPTATAIGFVTAHTYLQIRSYPWNANPARQVVCSAGRYYTLLPEEFSADSEVSQFAENFILSSQTDHPAGSPEWCLYTTTADLDLHSKSDLMHEARLMSLRRFLLIIVSESEPPNSYISYSDGKYWYSIASDDATSQDNFVLLGQFLTIPPAPTQFIAPPAPTIAGGPPK